VLSRKLKPLAPKLNQERRRFQDLRSGAFSRLNCLGTAMTFRDPGVLDEKSGDGCDDVTFNIRHTTWLFDTERGREGRTEDGRRGKTRFENGPCDPGDFVARQGSQNAQG
jgi:hypothetical protein